MRRSMLLLANNGEDKELHRLCGRQHSIGVVLDSTRWESSKLGKMARRCKEKSHRLCKLNAIVAIG